MPIGTTFSEAADLVRRNVFALVVIGAIVFVPLDLVTALIDDSRGWGDASLARSLMFIVVLLLGSALAYGAAIAAIAVEPEGAEEEPRTPIAALGDAGRRWPTLLALTVVGTLAILGGFLLLVVPGVLLLTWWFVAFQPAMIERMGWRESFGRSRQLVRGSFWQVLVAAIVVCVAVGVLDYGLWRVAEAVFPDFLAAWVAGVVGDTVATAFAAALTTAAYWQLRELERAAGPG